MEPREQKAYSLSEMMSPEWFALLRPEMQKEYMGKIFSKLSAIEASKPHTLCPSVENIFTAFKYCPLSEVKVVIIGQDPYPKPNEAMGMAFSSGVPGIPYSLKKIFRELESDGYGVRTNSDLSDWAKQGVFLLNTILTTAVGEPLAHRKWGWEKFTGTALQMIATLKTPVVYMLWGGHAMDAYKTYVKPIRDTLHLSKEEDTHLVIASYHPAAERYGNTFTGYFKVVNEHLYKHHPKGGILWV